MKFTARCNKHNVDLRLRFDGQVFVEAVPESNLLQIHFTSFFCPKDKQSIWSSAASCDGRWICTLEAPRTVEIESDPVETYDHKPKTTSQQQS